MALLRRSIQVVVTTLLALGLVATVSVDVAVAGAKRAHDRKVAAARAEMRAEGAFLARLAPIAIDIERAANPVSVALAAAESPSPASLVGARDALAHGGGVAALDSALKRLTALRPPQPMRSNASTAVRAVVDLKSALTALARNANVTNLLTLSGRLTGDSAIALTVADNNFTAAVDALFARQHLASPVADDADAKQPRTAADWIFDADSACIDADLSLVPAYTGSLTTPAALRHYVTLWQNAFRTLSHRLVTMPRPSGLPATITSRLGVLGYHAQLFSHQLTELKHGDYAALGVSLTEIKTAGPALVRLADGMRSYGVVGCANIMDLWAGVRPTAPKPASTLTI
jgi:hypothetical protein